MAKERTLTRTLAITEATLTVVDKTNKTIVPDFKVTLDGHFKNEASVLEVRKSTWKPATLTLWPCPWTV